MITIDNKEHVGCSDGPRSCLGLLLCSFPLCFITLTLKGFNVVLHRLLSSESLFQTCFSLRIRKAVLVSQGNGQANEFARFYLVARRDPHYELWVVRLFELGDRQLGYGATATALKSLPWVFETWIKVSKESDLRKYTNNNNIYIYIII